MDYWYSRIEILIHSCSLTSGKTLHKQNLLKILTKVFKIQKHCDRTISKSKKQVHASAKYQQFDACINAADTFR